MLHYILVVLGQVSCPCRCEPEATTLNKLDFTDPASKRVSVWDPIGHVVTLEQELAIQNI